MWRYPAVASLIAVGLALDTAAGCGLRPAAPPAPPSEACADSDGPGPGTVARAIAVVPLIADGADGADGTDGTDGVGKSTWIESARGHTRNCRLHWVKLALSDAMASSPEQLLFFDHDTPLGSPTAEPKPYTTVLSVGDDTVTVQYQWQVDDEPSCCPTGIGTTRYQIADGRLKALDSIPNP